MTSNLVTVIALVAGIVWLAVVFVSAVRNRGSEEIPANLKPSMTDAEMETRRVETGQKGRHCVFCVSGYLPAALLSR